jgi:hypothetical protein
MSNSSKAAEQTLDRLREYQRTLEFDRYELMPRDLAHGRHNSFVECSLADQVSYMSRRGENFREHMSTQDLKLFDRHCAIPMATAGIRHAD